MSYQQTVLSAAEEVENGLVTFLRSQERTKLLEETVLNSEKAVNVVIAQYKVGTVDFTRVAQIEQDLVTQQDALAQARGQISTGLITGVSRLSAAVGKFGRSRKRNFRPTPTTRPVRPLLRRIRSRVCLTNRAPHRLRPRPTRPTRPPRRPALRTESRREWSTPRCRFRCPRVRSPSRQARRRRLPTAVPMRRGSPPGRCERPIPDLRDRRYAPSGSNGLPDKQRFVRSSPKPRGCNPWAFSILWCFSSPAADP